jgi:hypothetical protein
MYPEITLYNYQWIFKKRHANIFKCPARLLSDRTKGGLVKVQVCNERMPVGTHLFPEQGIVFLFFNKKTNALTGPFPFFFINRPLGMIINTTAVFIDPVQLPCM